MNYIHNSKILFIFLLQILFFSNLPAQILRDTCIISRGVDPDIQVSQDSIIHISWNSVGENPNQRYTYYRQFNIQGNPITEPIKVSEGMGVQRTLLALGKERLIIVWRKVLMTFQSFVLGQIITNEGQLIESNFYINENLASDYERTPYDVLSFNDSLFCVIWTGDGDLSSKPAIYGQFISHSVRGIGSNFMISDFPDEDYSPAGGLSDYNKNTDLFITVWSDERDITRRVYARVFDSNLNFMRPSILLSDESISDGVYYPHVFWDTDSTLLLFYWVADEYNIYAQRVTIFGEPLTSAIQINETDGDVSDLSVSKDTDGKFIVIWTNDDYKQIYAQRIDNNLSFIGNNFIVTSGSYFLIYRLKAIIKNGTVYIAFTDYLYKTYLNIFDYDNPPVGVDDKQENLPQDFILSQNYPNPFNSTTSINFRVNVTSHVKMIVYDLLGKQIKIITNQNYTPGYYQIPWNGDDNNGTQMPSGIYFVKAILFSKTYSNKMVLIK